MYGPYNRPIYLIMVFNVTLLDALVFGAICLFYAYTIKQKEARKLRPYPPGPAPLPLLGNLLDIPSSYQHLTFAKWSERWGKYHTFLR